MCDIQVELPEPFCLAMCKVYFSFYLFWTPTYFYYVNMWHPSRVAWALLFGNVQGLIFLWVLLNTNIFLWTHATQTYPQLGRFVMREDGATVGIGVVTSFDCDQDCARDGDSSEWQTHAVCCCVCCRVLQRRRWRVCVLSQKGAGGKGRKGGVDGGGVTRLELFPALFRGDRPIVGALEVVGGPRADSGLLPSVCPRAP